MFVAGEMQSIDVNDLILSKSVVFVVLASFGLVKSVASLQAATKQQLEALLKDCQ